MSRLYLFFVFVFSLLLGCNSTSTNHRFKLINNLNIQRPNEVVKIDFQNYGEWFVYDKSSHLELPSQLIDADKDGIFEYILVKLNFAKTKKNRFI